MKVFLAALLLAAWVGAEEIPAGQVTKVDHREGFSVKTRTMEASVAIVWRKGAPKQAFMLVYQRQKGPARYFTIARPGAPVIVGEGKGIKVVLDQDKKLLRVTEGGKTVEEPFTALIDS